MCVRLIWSVVSVMCQSVYVNEGYVSLCVLIYVRLVCVSLFVEICVSVRSV